MDKTIALMTVLTILIVLPTIQLVFAATDAHEYINRRVEIWNLFFKMMTIAFTVGAVVSGTLIWLVWRFRESHPNAKPTKYEGTEW
ncbi:MAG: heme transporter CcmC [Candidatus Nitrosotenuis sp.]|jgi:heme/copper-type cytochrome/quinol oxidase subunit 2|nr:heme transporter CcmC [Candidatus Nitrosotenuis sp.]